jgi:hypothetical protein
MKDTHSQSCPLCQSVAQFQFVDANNRKHYRCPSCTEFQISVRAESRLASVPEWQRKYAGLARVHADGLTLTILLPTDVKEPGGASPELVGEYAKNADLPR